MDKSVGQRWTFRVHGPFGSTFSIRLTSIRQDDRVSMLKAVLKREIAATIGGDLGEGLTSARGQVLIKQREQALSAYHGEAIGNEVEGRSQAVMTDVADTIEWFMPSLLEFLTAPQRICKFKPVRAMHADLMDHAAMYGRSDELLVVPSFMDWLECVRHIYGQGMVITSGYRTPGHQATLPGKRRSGAHVDGMAVDVLVSGEDAHRLIKIAMRQGAAGIGVQQKGPYEKRYVHLDCWSKAPEGTRPRVWSY